jgi:hypothetical protein
MLKKAFSTVEEEKIAAPKVHKVNSFSSLIHPNGSVCHAFRFRNGLEEPNLDP